MDETTLYGNWLIISSTKSLICKEVFSKSLTAADISKRLVLPANHAFLYLPILGENEFVDLPVVDSDRNKRKFRYTMCRSAEGKLEPCFTCGWLEFTQEMGLQIGDEAVFSMRIKDQSIFYRQEAIGYLQVKRKSLQNVTL